MMPCAVCLATSFAAKPPVKEPFCDGDVPADDLDVLALLVVVVLHAVSEAVHEDGDGRELHAAEGADGAGLRVARRRVAAEERSLGGVEDDRPHVGQVDLVVVDRGEVDVRVGLGGLLGRILQVEADRDDQAAVLVDHALDVRGVVVRGLRLGLLVADAEVLGRAGEAFVAGLVERVVVEAAVVRDHAGQEVARHCGGRLAGGWRGRAPGEQRKGADRRKTGEAGLSGCDCQDVLQGMPACGCDRCISRYRMLRMLKESKTGS